MDDTKLENLSKSDLQKQIENLSENELYYIQHTLDAIEASRNESMHFFGCFLGMKEVENGIQMDLGKHNENTYGVTQGGALYTLADMAIGFYILQRLHPNEEVYTIELKVNFIKKGTGKHLLAETDILHWGRTTVVANCSIRDEEQNIVAQGLGTFYIRK